MLPTTHPIAPASPQPRSVNLPLGTRLPANGMITSEGSGMQALSIAISAAIPMYPIAEITPWIQRATDSRTWLIMEGPATWVSWWAARRRRSRRRARSSRSLPAPDTRSARRGSCGTRSPGLASPPRIRLERHLPSAAGQIDGQVRDREATGPAAQLAQDLDALGEGRSQVFEPFRDVHLVQVVGADPHGQALLHQVLDRGGAGVHPPHQHRLVLHGDALVDQPLAGLARLGRDLLGVVEVRDHEERREPAQRAGQLVVHAHGKADGNPGPDADDLDVGDGADPLQELDQPLGGDQQRISPRDEDVAHLGMPAQVLD